VEAGAATELVVRQDKYDELPADLQEIIRVVAQSEYDEMASDFYANDPRALRTLVNDHGVKVLQFPDEILEAGAKAASEILSNLRESGDALSKEMVESYAAALPLLRSRTENTDMPFLRAREKYFHF
jgi:TRAP-type mannitol/chloroaromatic compound transport system substrate-binding protein